MDEKTSFTDEAISNDELENNRKSNPRGRPKGMPKTGGRKKAFVEDTSKWDEILDQNFFVIPQEAIKLFFDKNTSNALKFSILQFLAQYTTPSIKPKEADSNNVSSESQTADILQAVK